MYLRTLSCLRLVDWAYSLTSSQVVHLIFSWSSFLSWILLISDVALMVFLALHAYRDGLSQPQKDVSVTADIDPVETLDYYEVPFFGHLANRFVDDE